jgi:hypothetical protein
MVAADHHSAMTQHCPPLLTNKEEPPRMFGGKDELPRRLLALGRL